MVGEVIEHKNRNQILVLYEHTVVYMLKYNKVHDHDFSIKGALLKKMSGIINCILFQTEPRYNTHLYESKNTLTITGANNFVIHNAM